MIERLCGFEVDDQIELAWRLHGRSAGLALSHPDAITNLILEALAV
jgi:hypothetical protein